MKNKSGFATPSAAIVSLGLSANGIREELEAFIWDTYKSIWGVRPRWMNFREWGIFALIEEADSLGAQIMAQHQAEIAEEKARVKKANEKALAARKFDQNFNSLANGLAALKF